MDKNGKGIRMGKASYRPKKNRMHDEKQVDTINHMLEETQLEEGATYQEQLNVEDEMNQMEVEEDLIVDGPIENDYIVNDYMEEEINTDYEPLIKETIAMQVHKENTKKLDNLKVVGDMECDYHIYLEDYVYTYLYQYAFSDLAKESSAILVGEVYIDSKEAIIRGIIPIDSMKLSSDNEWIGPEIIEVIEEQRKIYFADQDIIGWMHMQPGYGTMLTIKELREHRNVFEGAGSLFMLVDAINKIESVYVYEDDELKEQSGYCMYYERNEQMQQYMLDHPFTKKETEEIKDTVVNQFREIGKIRKEEYKQRRNVSLTAFTAAVVLIALTGVIVSMNGAHRNGQEVMNNQVALQNGVSHDELVDETLNLKIEANDVNNLPEDAKEVFAQSQVVNEVSGMNEGKEIQGDANVADQAALAGENATKEIAVNQGEVAASKESVKEEVEQELVKKEETEQVAKKELVKEEVQQVEAQKQEVTVVSEQIEEVGSKEQENYDIYVVKSGDTLANISFSVYGDASKSVEVAKLNGLDNTNQIYVGQKLKMPEK